MRAIVLLISLFVCTSMIGQTFTVYTNTIAAHNITTYQKSPDRDDYYKFTFSDTEVRIVFNGEVYQYRVINTEKDFQGFRFSYICDYPEDTVFFLRDNLVGKTTDDKDMLIVFKIYDRY